MNEFDRLIQAGEHLLDVERPEAALKQFEKALAIAPENGIALLSLARAFLMLKQPDRALKYAGRGIAADPTDGWGFRIKALAHLHKDQRTSAYNAAMRAVQLEPENIETLWTLGNCALGVGRQEEARVLGEIMVAQAPESRYGHQMLGEVAQLRDELPDAARHFEKALELEPTNAALLESLANIRNAHNKFGESVSLLRGALSVDPNQQRRQSSFRSSIRRFALFGQANERRKSVAGLMVTVFIAYLVIGVTAYRILDPGPWFNQVFLVGLVAVMAVGIPLLRTRFLASQSGQLQALYENMSRQKRRRTLLAAVVVVVAAYGIAGIVYLDRGDKFAFVVPLVLFVQAFWIYMLAITLRLVSLWMSDTWTRLMGKDVPADERGVPLTMIALPLITLGCLGIVMWNDNVLAGLVFLVGTAVSAFVFFKRFPIGTGLFSVLLGLGLVLFDVVAPRSKNDLTLGELGLIVVGIGACALALQYYARFGRYWQRRRIGRLFSGRDPGGKLVEHDR